MIPMREFKRELEKISSSKPSLFGSAIEGPINFAKRNPLIATSIALGIPASIAVTNAFILPYMAMKQRSQLQTSESQFRSESEQTRLLYDIAKSLKENQSSQGQYHPMLKKEPPA